MRNKEEEILNKLMDTINQVMVEFDEKFALKQKKEQADSLNLIKLEYKNEELEDEGLYFIGRFKIVGNLGNKLPADYELLRQKGCDMLHMHTLKNIMEKHIADEIGVSEVDIERSRDPAMVKVYISGAAIHQYIAMGLKLASFSLIVQEDNPLAGLFQNINNTMIRFNEEMASLQNAEQSCGLDLIKSQYLADQIEDTQEFFIGRFRFSHTNKEIVAEDIAKKIGVSSVQVAPSRGASMVKVFIRGDVIQQYISENSQQGMRL